MEEPNVTWYCADCLTTFMEKGKACPNLGCGQAEPELGWGQMYQPGDVIDRTYRVSRRLAFGGAGITYLVRALGADDEEVGPWIALKLLFASRDGGAYLRRLATEAQILQTLHHPNIVEYLGFVHRTGQSPYLLTQFEEGGSLIDHLKRVGTMGVRETAAVGRQVCEALQKGHAQGIIHRDLKPENLLLRQATPRGEVPQVRVADFGIAKVEGGIGASMTRMGAFVGTPQYAAPEQFLGAPASDKADIYSLGAVMVYLMTGRPMVEQAHTMAAEDVYARLEEVMPPGIARQSDTPEDCARMNQILGACMSMDPAHRCDVGQLKTLLDDLLMTQATAPAETSSITGESGAMFDAATATTFHPDTFDAVRVDAPPEGHSGSEKEQAEASSAVGTPESVQEDIGLGEPRGASSRGRLPGAIGGVVAVAIAVASVMALAPEWLDGIPGRGGSAQVSDGGLVRQLAERAAKSARAEIRASCPSAKGEQVEVEAVLNLDGTVRWARPVDRFSWKGWCVALELKGASAGSRLKSPYRVRLQVRP